MQALLSFYFVTVLSGGAVHLCRAVMRDRSRIGAALLRRDGEANGERTCTGFWMCAALQQQGTGTSGSRLQVAQRTR